MTTTDQQPKPRHGLFEFLLGGLVCVGVPGLMTAAAPVSWIELNRVNDQVNAKMETCFFFAFPYSTQELSDVRKVSTTFRAGENLHKRPGDGKKGRAESEGSIVLHGPEQEGRAAITIDVSVSPVSTKAVEQKINQFLNDPQVKTQQHFVVANWKVGILFAIPMCLLTVLFVVGWSIWLGQALARPFQTLRADRPNEPDEGRVEQSDL